MIIPLQMDQSLVENSKRKPFSPLEINPKQYSMSSKLNLLQLDIITPIQIKSNHSNSNIQFGLQKLLKTSPYAQLIKQKSQQQISSIDTGSQNVYNGTTQHSSQTNVKVDTKFMMTNNQNNIKRRIHNSMKIFAPKKSLEYSHQMNSTYKDKQTIKALQDLLIRSTLTLQMYKEQIIKSEQENIKLKEQLSGLQVQN
ncbi:unnamed protein product [Paramecium pentaurelia]|uniref:Uncharacterized protein n=1 Tax=Paramecium pentaurelia TaxID=43138 RepID=A0A8S1XMX8_9CILI|nr:unnamed protein product [Paramecium pentaurelia]